MTKFATCCAAAVALFTLGAWVRAEQKDAPRPDEFLSRAMECNSIEREVAQFAAKTATNPDVRAFAQRLAEDHTKMATKLADTAKNLKVTLTPVPDKAARDQVAAIEKLTGKDLDQKFLAFIVASHEKALQQIDQAAKQTKDEAVRAFAEEAAKAIRKHHEEAKELQKKLGA